MGRILKKLLATCLIGFGIGILLVILLPLSRLAIHNRSKFNCNWLNNIVAKVEI